MSENRLITPLSEVRRFIIDCFVAIGTKEENASVIADNLVTADYRGHYSHGLNRLEMYIRVAINKAMNPDAVPVVEKETPATALVNGNNGFGSLIGKFSMDLAVKKAKEQGIGMVVTHGSNHYGIAGIYALQAMEQGCVGISVTNTSPVMVPTRGKEACIGSNPISFGAPAADGDSLVLDMATTTVALGKLEIQKRKKQPLPSGWAVDNDGEVTNDPTIGLLSQKLLPLGGEEQNGGYKGYGLGLMVEVLAGIFSGSNYGINIPTWGGLDTANLGQAFIAINPDAFAPGFGERLADLTGMLRDVPPKDPTKPVLIPGDPEKVHMAEVDEQGGIYYTADQHKANAELAKELNVKAPKSIEIKQ